MKFNDFLEGKKEFKVAFLGGSITEGFGSSKPAMRYSSQLTELLNKRLPDTSFVEINAGIGGTPSPFGLFRLQHDVLSKEPDMLFVEFAVNDAGMPDMTAMYMEGIVRTARRYSPNMPIVFLYAYGGNMQGTSRKEPIKVITEQERVAKAYGIPSVSMGYDLLEKIEDYGGNSLFFTVDGGHPNDAGYASYADSIMRALFKLDFSFDFPEEPISGIDFMHPEFLPCGSMEQLPEGWKVSHRTLTASGALNYVFTDTVGASISYEFEGTNCGLYIRLEKDGGSAEIFIDGQSTGQISFCDRFCKDFDRDGFLHLSSGLSYGKHTLTLVVNDNRSEYSEGHVVRIAAFLSA